MMHLNLVILHPPGYIHSLCFLDTARYLRHHLRAFGIEARISKNRPEPDMVNIVFGGHLGVPSGWNERLCCIWFNQEQVGHGGSALPTDYLDRLAHGHVIDYDTANLDAYGRRPHEPAGPTEPFCGVMPLLHAPFLAPPDGGIPLEERPIDLLFFGSLNTERQALIERIESSGVSVSRFDHPMYGPERDAYIAQSKAVLNIPFYGTNRFEQVRVFNALSIGTPVVSLRRPGLVVESAYERTVHWFDNGSLESYFRQEFATATWMASSRTQLEHWSQQDPRAALSGLAAALRQLDEWNREARISRTPWKVTHLNLAGDKGYRPDWFNVSRNPLVPADSTGDPFETIDWPETLELGEHAGQPIRIESEQLQTILATDDAWNPERLERLIAHAARWLKEDGTLILDVSLGVYGESSTELTAIQQRMLAAIRGLLENHLARGEGVSTLELAQAESMQEPTISGAGTRQSLRLHLRRRTCTMRELVIRRSERWDYSAMPEDPPRAGSAVQTTRAPPTDQETT